MADPALPAFSSNQQSSFERADHLKSTFSYEAQAMMQHHAQLIADAEKLNKDLEVLRAQHSDAERALRVCNVKIAELQQHLATVHQMMGMVPAGAPDSEQNNILRHVLQLNQNIPQELATLEADKHQKEQERGRIMRNIQEIERTRQKYVKQAEIAESKARQMQAEAQLQQLQQQQQLSQAAARHIKKEEPEDDGDNDATRIVEITKTGDTLGLTICKTSHSPVFIAHILPNGPAAQQGDLRAGDEILKVNDVSVGGMPKNDVAKMIRDTEGSVKFEVRYNKELVPDEL